MLDQGIGVLEWHHPVDTGGFKRWVSWVKADSGEAGIAAAIREIEEKKLLLLCRSCHRKSHKIPPNQQRKRQTVLATEEEQLLLLSELVTDDRKKRCMREAKRLAM